MLAAAMVLKVLIIPLVLFGAIFTAVSPAQAEFVESGPFWGSAWPADWEATGAYSIVDGTDLAKGGNSHQNFNEVYLAIGTQDGGTSPASPSNLIDYFHFRVDHKGDTVTPNGNYNLQLNLGSAGPGHVDHLLQMRPTGTNAVSVALQEYNQPYPAVGAFTTGSLTKVATNVAGEPTVKPGVLTRTGQWDATFYGFEVAIPVEWFVDAPAGLIAADGSGAQAMVGAWFSSGGSFGAVANTRDIVELSADTLAVMATNAVTGETSFEDGTATQLAFTNQPTTAEAGAMIAPAIMVEVQDVDGVKVPGTTYDVTLTIDTTPGGGTLAGTKTVTAVDGTATFDDISIDSAGTGYTLKATAPNLADTTTDPFDISGPAEPATVSAHEGSAFSGLVAGQDQIVKAKVVDTEGAAVEGYTVDWAVTSGGGSLNAATSDTNVDGVAQITLTTGTTAGTNTVTATATGLTGSPVTYAVDTTHGAASQIHLSGSETDLAVGADGTFTATVQDSNGNTVTTGPDSILTIEFSQTDGDGSVSNLGAVAAEDGVAQITVAGDVPGSVTITASATTDANTDLTDVITFAVVPGGATPATSTITASPESTTADGSSTSTITVQLKDANGNNLEAGGATVTLDTDFGSLGSVTDNNDGTYTATLMASTSIGTATITGSVNSEAITGTATVEFTAGSADATISTISANPATGVTSNGIDSSMISITVRDANGNLVANEDIFFEITNGKGGSLSSGPWSTDGNGNATATLTSTEASTITVTGYLGTGNDGDAVGTATAEFTDEMTVTTSDFPDWTEGQGSYPGQLESSGGTAPYTWSTTTGDVPTGMTLESDGSFSGTPSATGTFTATYWVTDDLGATADQALSLTINAAPSISSSSPLDPGVKDEAYSHTFTLSDGTGPFTWSQGTGDLPTGMTLAADGELSGTPTQSGTFTFNVTINDDAGASHTKEFIITIGTRISAPSNTAPPTINGVQIVGEVLTVDEGTWQAADALAYQWLRCDESGDNCVPITGATSSSYTLVGADEGHTIRVNVTATNSQGSSTAGAPPTGVVVGLTITSPTPDDRTLVLRGTGLHSVSLQGTGFLDGATVAVTGLNVEATNVEFVSYTELTVDIETSSIATPGPRTITVQNPTGQVASTRGLYIEALPGAVIQTAPEADNVHAYADVFFLDSSRSIDPRVDISAWSWDFGDGNTSTVAAPVHQYAAPGDYTVDLSVTDSRGHQASTSAVLKVQQPVTDLTASIHPVLKREAPRSPIEEPATFHAITSGGTAPFEYSWDIKGQVYTGASVTHNFTRLGSYPVTLTVTDAHGATQTTSITIHVFRPQAMEDPEAVPLGGSKAVSSWEGGVTLNAKNTTSPTAHVKTEIGASPEAVDRDPTLSLDTGSTKGIRYMAVTVFDEHEILDFENVRIQFNYTEEDLEGFHEDSLKIRYWNGSAWLDTRDFVGQVMPGDTSEQDRYVYETGHDKDQNIVWAVLNQPSEYVLSGSPITTGGGGGGGGGGGSPAPSPSPGSEPMGFDRSASLRVEAKGDGAHLEWTPSESFANETIGYQVWRSTSPWTLVGNVSADQSRFLDPDATDGARFKVTYYTDFTLAGGFVGDLSQLDLLNGWDPTRYGTFTAEPVEPEPAPPRGPPVFDVVPMGPVSTGFLLAAMILATIVFVADSSHVYVAHRKNPQWTRAERRFFEHLAQTSTNGMPASEAEHFVEMFKNEVRGIPMAEKTTAAMEASITRAIMVADIGEHIREDLHAVREHLPLPTGSAARRRRKREAQLRRLAQMEHGMDSCRELCCAQDLEARRNAFKGALQVGARLEDMRGGHAT